MLGIAVATMVPSIAAMKMVVSAAAKTQPREEDDMPEPAGSAETSSDKIDPDAC
jgi:hypothetical protein